jgi:hypothetical protein
MAKDTIFNYKIDSRSFLKRAIDNLEIFEKEGIAANFFYSALELRFGIEARLNEYISAALNINGSSKVKVPEHAATRLLARLNNLNEHSENEKCLRFTSNKNDNSTELVFTPVTKNLANIHGKLGELLHYKFFNNNEYWYVRDLFINSNKKSILNYVALIKEGIEELKYATSGNLLYSSSFKKMVNEEFGVCEE